MTTNDDPNRPFKLPRPNQIKDLSPDQVVAVVLRLAMEVSVLRDRLRTHELLIAELSPEDVDQFTPAQDEASARQQARTDLIDSIINDLS
ncbi:MAG: hypothetical protein AB8B96_13330 [Lysobacterales bacterium]